MFPGKESPWSVLGLESATATVRDVKRCYAKLLKQHRPDADPEGFQRVHEAYTTALHELEVRDLPEAEAAVGPLSKNDLLPLSPGAGPLPVPARPPQPNVNLPEAFVSAVERLRASPDIASAPEILTQWRTACGENAELWREWSRELAGIFDTVPAAAPVAAAVPPADVLKALRAGSGEAAVRILDLWHRERLLPNMVSVGQALTAKGTFKDYDHPACGFYALRLAFLLAIPQPGGANLLIDAAFSWLPSTARSHSMRQVENRLEIGRIFWHVPVVWQGFWEKALDELDAGRSPDWESADARRAINDLLRVTPADWPGWGFLKSQLTELQWQGIVDHFNGRPVSRRSWTSPPERTWINPAASAGAGSGSFQARHPESRKRADADAWSIPDTDIPVRPQPAAGAEPKAPLPGDAVPAIKQLAEVRKRERQLSGFKKVLHQYYRIPRMVRILLLCTLTWTLVFGLAYLWRIVSKNM